MAAAQFRKSKAIRVSEEQNNQPGDELTPLEEQIRRRAYEIYLEQGGLDGSDLDHWFQAKEEIAAAQAKN
jgi:hypothetical protein